LVQESQVEEQVGTLPSSKESCDRHHEPESKINQNKEDFSDPSNWNRDNSDLIHHILSNPAKINVDQIDLSTSEYHDSEGKLRRAHSDLFFRTESKEGRRVLRDWLQFSYEKGSLYCVPCFFFGKSKSTLCEKNGFRDWKHAKTSLSDHEQTTEHFHAIATFMTRSEAVKGRIDLDFIKQYQTEKEYWIQVLRRIIEVIKHLSSRFLCYFSH
jgi:hypothetical protein